MKMKIFTMKNFMTGIKGVVVGLIVSILYFVVILISSVLGALHYLLIPVGLILILLFLILSVFIWGAVWNYLPKFGR